MLHTTRCLILLVDDERINQTIIKKALSTHFDVILASSGQEALDLARQSPQPQLILLDIMMPDMSGYQVLEQLKSKPQTHDIPVILLTALGSDSDKARGIELGACDYLTKPCSLTTLLNQVRRQLQQNEDTPLLRD